MTDIVTETRGFPELIPVDAPPELGRFVTNEPLIAHGWIAALDGRRAFITATMTTAGGRLLTEANGLMIRLLPHQP